MKPDSLAFFAPRFAPGFTLDDARDRIVGERGRQIVVEGYTPDHDAGRHRELFAAGLCYFATGTGADSTQAVRAAIKLKWPWGEQHWKPKSPEADLVRAGALFWAARDVCTHAAFAPRTGMSPSQRERAIECERMLPSVRYMIDAATVALWHLRTRAAT